MLAQDRWMAHSLMSVPLNLGLVHPVEVAERDSPLFLLAKQLRPGSGGAGRYRGGLGEEIRFVSRHDSAMSIVFLTERLRWAAPGIGGGEAGAPGEVLINGASIDSRVPHVLQPGDEVTLRTPGGGGYGPPADRAAADSARDLRMGYVTA